MPTCADEGLTANANENSAIDDRNQVSIGNMVENAASPWTVNAGKEHVAIKRCTVAIVFHNAAGIPINAETFRRTATLRIIGCDINLEPPDILVVRTESTIQIDNFNAIIVDKNQALHTHTRECFTHDASNTAESDDSEGQSSEFRLSFSTPDANTSIQLGTRSRN